MEDRSDFIQSNLDELAECTNVESTFLTFLLSKKLVNRNEFQYLESLQTNYRKAISLYITVIPKWGDVQFTQFISVLKETGNEKAYNIFTTDGAEVFLTSDQVQFLKVQMKLWSKSSNYEGFCPDDEMIAKTVQGHLNDGKFFLDEKFKLDKTLEERRREVVPLIKNFVRIVKENRVWINPSKTHLPSNYIKRKVQNETSSATLIEIVIQKRDKLVLVADAPGMGKSSGLTKLEIDLRNNPSIPLPRIIIRKNLNQCSTFLKQISEEKVITLSVFMKRFADFIPEVTFFCPNGSTVPVYVLLDGLDEVLPLYSGAMMNLLAGLLKPEYINKPSGYYIEMVVLTTRPHLRKMIEEKFSVNAYALVPLSDQEQIEYLTNQVGISNMQEAQRKLEELPKSVRSLMSNPLMLHIYSQVFFDSSSGMLDLYSLYTKFMEKKHEVFISEKEHGDLESQPTLYRKKQLLNENLRYYYYIAVKEMTYTIPVADTNLDLIFFIDEQFPGRVMEVPSEVKLEELLSYGLIVHETAVYPYHVRFKHRSFAEYFYAKMMTDVQNTPAKIRNALFACEYKDGSNLADFVSCVINKDEKAVQFVSTGWTELVQQVVCMRSKELSTFTGIKGKLQDHILNNTIEYDKKCEIKNKLLVRDMHTAKVFIRWLSEIGMETRVKFLLQKNMNQVLAAILFSPDDEIQTFATKFLLVSGKIEDIIKEELKKCKNIIQVAVQLESKLKFDPSNLFADFLLERLRKWMSMDEIKKAVLECINNPELFIAAWVENTQLSSFIASVLSKNELFRLVWTSFPGNMNFCRCWGKEFCLTSVLKFRFKSGYFAGKSFFQSSVNEDFMDVVWSEVKRNVQDACNIFYADGNILFLIKLETNLREFMIGSPELYKSRRNLLIDILARLDWSQFNPSQAENCHTIAYAKMTAENWQKYFTQKSVNMVYEYPSVEMLNNLLALLLLSAHNEEQSHKDSTHVKIGPPPFKLVLQWVKDFKCFSENFSLLITTMLTSLSRKELSALAKLKTQFPVLLSDLPSVGEVFSCCEQGLANVNTEKAMVMYWSFDVIEVIVKDILCSSGQSVIVLELLTDFLGRQAEKDSIIRIMNSWNVISVVENCALKLWLKDVDIGKEYVKNVVEVYTDCFGECGSWLDKLSRAIPVQLLVIGEEKRKIGDQIWSRLDYLIKIRVKKYFKGTFRFWNQNGILKYNRECDWYRLFKEFPELQDKIPADFQEKSNVHLTWECSLFRVCIQLFGKNANNKQISEKEYVNFIDWAAYEMKDGELLHIAVELESLSGVKSSAWPAFINWTNGDNQTALELSQDQLGRGHEITKYLQMETDNLVASGFIPERKK